MKLKSYLLALFAIVCLFNASFFFADEPSNDSVLSNYYVTTGEKIIITSEGLFINIENINIPVVSLHTANDGYIVAITNPQAAICPRCRRDTYTPGRTCSNCGFPVWKIKAE